LVPHIQVFGPRDQPADAATYQQLVTVIATRRLVRLHYQAQEASELTVRAIEPIGLYLSRHWHVVAYCRLRQGFRYFRLDRIQQLELREELVAARREALQQYWAQVAYRRPTEKVVLRYQPTAVLPALAQQLQATKHQYGWAHEQLLPDGSVEMTLFIGSFDYLAAWLLPHAGAVTVVEPLALREHLRAWARRAHHFFDAPPEMLT
jgi:predicted DNA-binding transcriptional regulator YafY